MSLLSEQPLSVLLRVPRCRNTNARRFVTLYMLSRSLFQVIVDYIDFCLPCRRRPARTVPLRLTASHCLACQRPVLLPPGMAPCGGGHRGVGRLSPRSGAARSVARRGLDDASTLHARETPLWSGMARFTLRLPRTPYRRSARAFPAPPQRRSRGPTRLP